jgi:hypothetical protein
MGILGAIISCAIFLAGVFSGVKEKSPLTLDREPKPSSHPDCLFEIARETAPSGVAEGVKKISGSKTRSMCEHYAIVSDVDISDAMSKRELLRQPNLEELQPSAASENSRDGQSAGKVGETYPANSASQLQENFAAALPN